MLEKEKRKQPPPRSFLLLFIVGLMSLLVGAASGYVLHPSEIVTVYLTINTTPTNFTMIYAAQDIPCGIKIEPDMVLEIVVEPSVMADVGLSQRVLRGSTSSSLMDYVPGHYATGHISKGQHIDNNRIASEQPVCPTPTPR
jgi:hypothetical protein